MTQRGKPGALWVVAALLLTGGSLAAQQRDTRQPAQAVGTAVISGTVVTDEATPMPVRRAMVTLAMIGAPRPRQVSTDENGRFAFAGLAAGRYNLSATKAGFVRIAYGAKRFDRPGTPITLADGQLMRDVGLRLVKGGVITGLVRDEHGLPAASVQVRALQYRTVLGERQLQPAAAGNAMGEATDDRGQYRLYGLPPGDYLVTASPRIPVTGEVEAMTDAEIRAALQALQNAQASQTPAAGTPASPRTPAGQPAPVREPGTTVTYAPVYFPGTTLSSSAALVTVGAGEERSGVDMAMTLVRTTKVEGTVVPPPGMPAQAVQLMLLPAGGSLLGAGIGPALLNRAPVGPDGRFSYTAIPPGQYTLTARILGGGGRGAGPAAAGAGAGGAGAGRETFQFTSVNGQMIVGGDMASGGTTFWGMADVTVDGTPVTDVAVVMQPGMTITGRVEFRGARAQPPTDLTRVRVNLVPAPTGAGNMVVMGLPTTQVDASGRFAIVGVTPGKYRLTATVPVAPGSGPGLAWTLKSAIVKGLDVLDFSLDVLPNDQIGDALLTFGDATQEVSGTLQDPTGRPAPDYTIVVFASDAKFWTPQSRRIRTTRPGTDGRFSVANLPAGDYRIAAVIDIAPNEANDPAFLEQLVPASYQFALAEGEKKSQDLRIATGGSGGEARR
jgi:Ni,Fe-hydrogenase III small subunit